MESKLTKDCLTRVNDILSTPKEQDLLFQSLNQYSSDSDLDALVSSLQTLVLSQDRVPLFEALRPLIWVGHQVQFDRKTHRLAAKLRVRVVRLSLRQGPLGFAFRGGLEHGVGCFVSQVVKHSPAALAGLRLGDEILRVNGFPVARATHEEAVALIRARSEVVLKVKRVGMIPKKDRFNDPVSWDFSNDADDDETVTGSNEESEELDGEEIRVFVNTRGASLGCTIFSGPPHHPGIFLHSVRPDGLAEQAGLRPGDRLVQVNGVAFGSNISHSHAVMVLKSRAGIHMTIRRSEGLKLLNEGGTASPSGESTSGDKVPRSPQSPAISGGGGEARMQVKRHRNEDETSLKTPPDSATPTNETENGNIILRAFSIGDKRETNRTGHQSPDVPRSPSFSDREASGRLVETVRVVPKRDAPSGLELEEVPGGAVAVASVAYGSPVFHADVRLGDFLLAVEREKIAGLRFEAVLEKLKLAEQKLEFELSLARAPADVYTDEITYL